jgi:methyltransferase-like protein 6
MTTSLADNNSEVSLAVSYYELYSRTPVKERDVVEDEEESVSKNNNIIIVQDDTWTAQELALAASLLQESQRKCQITARLPEETESESWNRFYQSHRTNFFKDKHYLTVDFPDEFLHNNDDDDRYRCCVEIGCGVGNAILSLLEECNNNNSSSGDDNQHQHPRHTPSWIVHCLDFSANAIDLLQQEPRFVSATHSQRAFAHVCDIAQSLPTPCVNVATVTTLFFCLSAIHPDHHLAAARNVYASLQNQGVLILRDYGRYDAAQLKLGQERNKLVQDHFYRKHDGTKCYYFTLDDLQRIFVDQLKMQILELRYMCKVFENRSTDTKRRRVWVSARFCKVEEKSNQNVVDG